MPVYVLTYLADACVHPFTNKYQNFWRKRNFRQCYFFERSLAKTQTTTMLHEVEMLSMVFLRATIVEGQQKKTKRKIKETIAWPLALRKIEMNE